MDIRFALIQLKSFLLLTLVLACSPRLNAQDQSELAKQLANPVANLISVPFQANWQFDVGVENDTRWILNIQPVIPVSITENWNLIGRIILPVINQPKLTVDGSPEFGTGDIVLSGFFSPAASEKLVWGVGPVILLPTSSSPLLGSEKWGAGPTLVFLKQINGLTLGALANQIWSFAGDASRNDVSSLFLQPFLAYASRSAVTISLNTETTANWKAKHGQKWTVPINLSVSKLVPLGRNPISLQMGAGYYVASPSGGPSWTFRGTLTMLFPK